MPAGKAPRGFESWLAELRRHDIGATFQPEVAAMLRVMAATKNAAVALATGTEAIPYVPWLQDGIPMNGRLILHHESRHTVDLVQPHLTTDIRIATHQQDFAAFLADIHEHRFDLVVFDLGDLDPAVLFTLPERLSEHGLLVALGSNGAISDFIAGLEDSFFAWPEGQSDGCALLSRKSLQHRAGRRGGRRRHKLDRAD